MKLPPPELVERIITAGKQYESAPLPASIPRGTLGRCFDNCMLQAMRNRDLRYVEGVAMMVVGNDTLKTGLKRKWVLHAWLTDGEHAYDPTWYALDPEGNEKPAPAVYIGIEMDIKAVANFVRTTEYAGVIANEWRAPELAKAALTSHVHA